MTVWEGFVVVPYGRKQFFLLFADCHDNQFFSHSSISFCLTMQSYYDFLYYANIYYIFL